MIGVFDSGIGGTTTLNALREVMPNENFFYFGDTARNPYGEKSQEELEGIVTEICDFLIQDKKVKMIVVACNTATTKCIDFLRRKYPEVIFVGTEPAVKLACDSGASNILVMATPGTVESERMAQLIADSQREGQTIELVGCPGLADAVESKDKSSIDTKLKEVLSENIGKKYDVVVLGCTHYILIKDKIQELFPGAKLVDGNKGIAKKALEELVSHGLTSESENEGSVEYYFTK